MHNVNIWRRSTDKPTTCLTVKHVCWRMNYLEQIILHCNSKQDSWAKKTGISKSDLCRPRETLRVSVQYGSWSPAGLTVYYLPEQSTCIHTNTHRGNRNYVSVCVCDDKSARLSLICVLLEAWGRCCWVGKHVMEQTHSTGKVCVFVSIRHVFGWVCVAVEQRCDAIIRPAH